VIVRPRYVNFFSVALWICLFCCVLPSSEIAELISLNDDTSNDYPSQISSDYIEIGSNILESGLTIVPRSAVHVAEIRHCTAPRIACADDRLAPEALLHLLSIWRT
jgi:hypothetical protein